MRSRVRSFCALFGVVALGALGMVAFAPSAVAAAVPASIPDGDPGSLRDVLDNAANGATVELEAGATYRLTDCEAGDNGALNTSQDLIIVGNGATLEQTCDSYVWESEGNLSIDGLTITGGFDINDRPAGAIHMDGEELTITNSSIVNNQTCADGGGIYMHTGGVVHIENSTIAGNSAAGSGGAIAANSDDSTEIEIVNSTITGNSAGWGGAIDLQEGEQLSLTYVTLAGNTTDAEGISCESDGESLDDVHGAVTSNVHAQANGSAANVQFDSSDSTLTTFGSVIALPVEGPNCNVEVDVIKSLDTLGNTDSGGYNYSDDESCDLTGTGDRQGAADPQLTALGPNGGPTETRPPTETSPLVDGVPLAECHPDGIAADQRGITRPQRNGCDIGAVELVFTEPTPAPEPLPLVVTPRFTG